MTEPQVHFVLLLRVGGALMTGSSIGLSGCPMWGMRSNSLRQPTFVCFTHLVVRAVVTGIEPEKHSPIRAREL